MPLYDQARLHPPSPAQVLRWLFQLADALAALEAQGVVHRDVKGGNVLVRRSDGRAMLMDFGTGIYPGAAAPADDLYALGVTACRLLTGEYPEMGAPLRDEHGKWHLEAVIPPRALLGGPQVEPSLRDLTLRMLSVDREQRGTAAQWAKALEQASRLVALEDSEEAPSKEAQGPFAWPWSCGHGRTLAVSPRRKLPLHPQRPRKTSLNPAARGWSSGTRARRSEVR